MSDLEGLLERLLKEHVDFVVAGGFAAVAHGSTLVTMDIDICCRFDAGNLMALQRALRGVHPVHRMTPQRIPLKLAPRACETLKNLYLDTDYGQLDCLGAIAGIGPFEDVKNRSEEIVLPFGRCRVLTLDALIEAKKAMGRPRDKEAVLQLQAIQERLESGKRRRHQEG